MRIAVVVGSTRTGRRSEQVARWVLAEARARPGVGYELLDLADTGLPLLDEPVPAALGEYADERTRRWAARVAAFDGFVFVVPEYNHAAPAVVKNAVDHLFAEWHDKAAGFVTFGMTGGVRAAESLRLVLAEVKVATVRSQVALTLRDDFAVEDIRQPGTFTPDPGHLLVLHRMLDEVEAWSGALATIR